MPDTKQRIDVHVYIHSASEAEFDLEAAEAQIIQQISTSLTEFITQSYPKLDFLISQSEQFAVQLKTLQETGDKILMTEQEALAVLDKIDTTTTKMGATQQSDADLLQKISDEIDTLKTTAGVPASVATRLGTLSDTIQKISDNGDAQATLLAAIATKGAPVPTAPVPTPVPSV